MLLVANWKMNMTRSRIAEYLSVLERSRLKDLLDQNGLSAVVVPSHVYLDYVVGEVTRRGLPIDVFAQDVSTRTSGAFTGEVGVPNLLDVGVKGSLLGHSERRRFFRETDEDVVLKAGLCLKSGLVTVICFGETREERRAGALREVVLRQLAPIANEIAVLRKDGIRTPFLLAYEPVWAIGTSENASPGEIEEVFSFVSSTLVWPETPQFLYGGSVNLDNVRILSALSELSGFLVGSAWIDPGTFLKSAEVIGNAGPPGK